MRQRQQRGGVALLRCGELLDQRTRDVADGDVGFLDALRVAGRNVQQQIDFGFERASAFAETMEGYPELRDDVHSALARARALAAR